MWSEITSLWQSLGEPEYLHLLLEPLPLYGLALGLLLLLITSFSREKICRLVAVILLGASCLSVAPYLSCRLSATPRILATRPVSFGPAIEAQTQLRQRAAWAYYLGALFSAITLGMMRNRHQERLLMALAAYAVLLFWLSLWLHKKECELYHPNILRHSANR